MSKWNSGIVTVIEPLIALLLHQLFLHMEVLAAFNRCCWLPAVGALDHVCSTSYRPA